MNLFDLNKIEYLRIIARRSGYTHKEIALMIGISEAYLSLWFAGKRNSKIIEEKLRDLHGILHPTERRIIKVMRMGYTQSAISKNLRVTPAFFNKWLNGKRNSKRLDAAFEAFYRNSVGKKTKRSS